MLLNEYYDSHKSNEWYDGLFTTCWILYKCFTDYNI